VFKIKIMKLNLYLILIQSLLKAQAFSPVIIRRPELRVTSMTLSVNSSQIAYDFRIADGGSTPVECGFIYSYNTIYPNGENDPNDQTFTITTPADHNGVITGTTNISFLIAAYYFIPYVRNKHNTVFGTRVVLAPNWPTVTINSKLWVQANLGASQVATSATDASSYGFLYQWGRGSDGHQVRTSPTTTTLSNGPSPGNGSFILSDRQDGNWMNQNPSTTSWAGTTAINNPCPSGWRIPTRAEWTWFMSNLRVSNNSVGFNASTAYSNDFNIRLPSGGQRHRLNGSLTNANHHGYWLNNSSSGGVQLIYFLGTGNNNNWGEGGDAGAYGAGVRCIQN
jgi:uncharacterized protein (TIGR02145 family)